MSIRTIFFGTPNFAVPILGMLVKHPLLEMVCVVAQPDKPVGRKQVLTSPPTKVIALANSIPVYQPSSLRSEEALQVIADYKPDLIVVAAYGKIVPEGILNLPKYQCLNVHPSDLPKYRGASPLQYTVWKNEKETKTSIMIMEASLDTGPIIAQSTPYQLSPTETYLSLENHLSLESAKLLQSVIEPWCNQTIKAQTQDHQKATYTKILTKEDGKITWAQAAEVIDCQIRALNPWPSTYTFLDQKRVKVDQAQVSSEITKKPVGTLYSASQKLYVACGDQTALQILSLQLEGKSKMTATEFMTGYGQYLDRVFA